MRNKLSIALLGMLLLAALIFSGMLVPRASAAMLVGRTSFLVLPISQSSEGQTILQPPRRGGLTPYSWGFRDGFRQGYQDGIQDCYQHFLRRSYRAHSIVGEYNRGYADGYSRGYSAGYNSCY